jgi:putative peptidoglycan lipid II flippase
MTGNHRATTRESTAFIVRATALATGLTMLGALLGLGRDLTLAHFFGATGQTDAFLVAWTVPETASPLLIEGAMAYLMVPIFVRALAGPGGLAGVVRSTLPRILALLAVGAAAIALAAPLLVAVLAPGLAEPELAVRCTRVTAITVLAFGLAGYLAAGLRSVRVFGWPASIYIAYNVGILVAIAWWHEQLGVLSAAIGVAAGSVLMVVVQTPSFVRHLSARSLLFEATGPRVALGAFIPIAVFTLTRQAQVFVERFLGSDLAAGTISHLNYAQKVAQVPMVLSIMVATVTFPMLAHSVVSGDEEGSRARIEWDLRVVSGIVLAASAYVIAFAEPIIQALFQRGAFTAADTAATAGIMRVYAFGLLGQSTIGVLSRSYFSFGHPIWYPALVMGAGLGVTAIVSVVLIPVWQGNAIAAGNAAGITLTAALMVGGLRRRVAAISLPAVGTALGRLAAVATVTCLAGLVLNRLMTGLPAPVVAATGLVAVTGLFLLLGAVCGAVETGPLRRFLGRARHAR